MQNIQFYTEIKHEYLRSRASTCVSLSSPAGDISIKSWTIEILVLTSWIPASKNLFLFLSCVLVIFTLIRRCIFSFWTKFFLLNWIISFMDKCFRISDKCLPFIAYFSHRFISISVIMHIIFNHIFIT